MSGFTKEGKIFWSISWVDLHFSRKTLLRRVTLWNTLDCCVPESFNAFDELVRRQCLRTDRSQSGQPRVILLRTNDAYSHSRRYENKRKQSKQAYVNLKHLNPRSFALSDCLFSFYSKTQSSVHILQLEQIHPCVKTAISLRQQISGDWNSDDTECPLYLVPEQSSYIA